MATASSAQREPSMEEILASIRRIIEDSDTGRKQPAEAGELRQDLEPAAAAVSPAAVPNVEVDAFRSELHADARKPVTLAEVQAQLAATDPALTRAEARHEPVRAAPAPTNLEVGARSAAQSSASPAASKPAAANAPQTAETIVTDWRREIAAAGGSTVTAKPTARAPEAAPRVEIEKVEIEKEEVRPATEASAQAGGSGESEPEAQPARHAILSEHTGRQVAAAFGELSDAFASRGKKSFDEMAEEMLRPMLQDWLDNNLPTLVERLVREEIERVARGAQ
ncbi:PopZ family protein [Mesorhizobium sp. CA8]|uniref:PopZ family protein n=1 Tax=Mesorhizobium sp. CA8 TaxID=2876637 RepID=UPI001CCF5A98|nr:PopZ family protein [Mesorhizobium sp. CA8]MBZ9760257.1 PopZ family protein [Mesorhizobium sp. CA8]